MMAGEVGYRTFWTNGGGQGVELPYGGDAFTAVAILPPDGQDIADFVAGLDPQEWAGWMAGLDAQAEASNDGREGSLIRFPKLEIDYERLLNDDLEALGMTDAFDPVMADFTRLTPLDLPAPDGPPWVRVSKVKQKSFLKVDERGTEAAAATSVEVVVESAPMPLSFDHPFLFAIRERLTGTILFMGVIGDPTA
jgi:serpin B